MNIRRIRPDEGALLRDVRLRALSDAPDAFEESRGELEALPPEHWEAKAVRGADGFTSVTFLAEADAACVGMAAGFIADDLDGLVLLASMWVEPAQRRKGIGRALVEAVEAWCRARGALQIRLWVTNSNMPATALYRACGFDVTSASRPLASNPSLRETLMLREL